jgi:hypothetical protein
MLNKTEPLAGSWSAFPKDGVSIRTENRKMTAMDGLNVEELRGLIEKVEMSLAEVTGKV